MAGLRDRQNALCKVNIRPLQSDELADPEAAVKAQKNAVQLVLLARKNGLLYLLLFGEGKALDGLFREFRTFELIRRILLCEAQEMRGFEGALDDGDDGVDAVCGEAHARTLIAALQEFRDERLQDERREFIKFHSADLIPDMLFDNKPIPLVSPHLDGRSHIIFQP